MHHFYGGTPGETPLGLLKQAVVPLHPVPGLSLLYQPQASLQSMWFME